MKIPLLKKKKKIKKLNLITLKFLQIKTINLKKEIKQKMKYLIKKLISKKRKREIKERE